MALPTVPSTGSDISNATPEVSVQEALVALLTDLTNIQTTVDALVAWSKNASYAASTIPTATALVTTASGAVKVTQPQDYLQDGTVVAGA